MQVASGVCLDLHSLRILIFKLTKGKSLFYYKSAGVIYSEKDLTLLFSFFLLEGLHSSDNQRSFRGKEKHKTIKIDFEVVC